MKIINKQNIITGEQIERIIEILGKDYKPSRVIIYENKFDMIRYYPVCFNFSIEEFTGKLEGSYDESDDTVYVCIFSQIDDGDDLHSKQLYSIHAMVHELRHRYQFIKSLFTEDEEEAAAEKDADDFATNFVNNNSRQISNIMGWEGEWTVEEED